MGNRAVITFDKTPTNNSVGVYLHWNGGEESVVPFVKALDRYEVRDNDDTSYQLARFIQLVGNYFGGTLSLGVGNLRTLDINGDNGLYVVERLKGITTIRRSDNGLKGPFKLVDQEKAMKHVYNNPTKPENGTLSDQLDEVNLAIFKKD